MTRACIVAMLAMLPACGSRGGLKPTSDGTADMASVDLAADRGPADLTPDRAPTKGWAVGAGGTQSDWGWDLAVDAQGNVFVTGHFTGTAHFGPHTLHSSGGSQDMFLTKVDDNGKFLWAVGAGSSADDKGCSVTLDPGGNVLVTGLFNGGATFGSEKPTSNGVADLFVAKYEPQGGQVLWVSTGGSKGADWGWRIRGDGAGGAFVVGKHVGKATFGSHTLPAVSGDEALVTHINASGTFDWASTAGWYGAQSAWGVTGVNDGEAIVTGRFQWTVDFGSITLGAAGNDDVFVARYSKTGKVLWAASGGGNGEDAGWAADSDGSGGAYVTGFFNSMAHFAQKTVHSKGHGDVFVGRYSQKGQLMWLATAGGAKLDRGYGVARDGTGVVVTGYFAEQADFGSSQLASKGDWDLFLARLTESGAWDWALSAGGTGHERPAAVVLGPNRTAYLTGEFSQSPSFGGTDLKAAGGADIFVWKTALP